MALTMSVGLPFGRRPFSQRGSSMTLQSRLESLKERHAALETRIAEEDQRPMPDSETLNRLKIEKLHVKEEIERLRTQVE